MFLAIDPGETVGVVSLELRESVHLKDTTPSLHVVKYAQFETEAVSEYVLWLYPELMGRFTHYELVIIEDYRIYQGLGNLHTGQRLYTPELIGATRALCTLAKVPCVSVPASWKGKWPPARLKAKFSVPDNLPRPHALDALLLGLAHLEKEGLWTP